MIRITLESLLLFLVPFILFALWLRLSRKPAFDPEHWSGPLLGIVIAGLVLVAMSFVLTAFFAEHHVGAYVPAHVEKGQLVPGHYQ